MRMRWILCASLALATNAQPLHAETQTWFGFQVGISSGAPPPRPLLWSAEPQVVVINHVAVVDDDCSDDVFRYGTAWYRMQGGWWYRSSTWRGPWASVDVRRVPEAVLVVPAKHWKRHPHGGPPGQRKKRGVVVVNEERGRAHGHGHDGN